MKTKEKVLQILQNNKDCVSGELLADECKVSRAAVWKAVKSLRDDGFLIEGTTNGGYKFMGQNDLFSKEAFSAEFSALFSEFSTSHIECFEQIDSTNNYAKKILSECGSLRDESGNLTEAGRKYHNCIIVAESQTAGRGRLGREFVSPKKSGIYLSVIYAPKEGIQDPAKLTAFSAVAVCRTLKKLFNIDAKIKWVNDVFLNGKKVCGILTEGIVNFETRKIESAIVGIGLNIFENDEFSEKLKKVAGSVFDCGYDKEDKNQTTRIRIAAQIAGETLSIFSEDSQKVIGEYREKSFLIGKKVFVHPVIGNNDVYEATVLDIDQNAALLVKTSDGKIRSLNSGEVSIKSDCIIQMAEIAPFE